MRRNKKNNSQTDSLNISAVSQLSGISAYTLRSWEKRYAAIEPRRTPSGQRIYSLENVEKLKLLDRLVSQGHTISRIASLNIAKLRELQNLQKVAPATVEQQPFTSNFILNSLEKNLNDFDLDALSRTLLRARTQCSIKNLVLDVLSPFMTFIGNQVSEGKISIAQEHAFSAIARDHLGEIYQSLRNISNLPLNIVFTTPEGDLHEFGIFLAAILAVNHGAKAHYLGSNLPSLSLIDACKTINPQVVILGLTSQHYPHYLDDIQLNLPSHIQIWIGGPNPVLSAAKKHLSQPPAYSTKTPRSIQYLESLHSLDSLLRKLF